MTAPKRPSASTSAATHATPAIAERSPTATAATSGAAWLASTARAGLRAQRDPLALFDQRFGRHQAEAGRQAGHEDARDDPALRRSGAISPAARQVQPSLRPPRTPLARP